MKCYNCGETRESEFSPSHILHHDYRCASCRREYYHQHYQANKKRMAEYSRLRRLNNPEVRERQKRWARNNQETLRIKVISHYSQNTMVCAICGFSDIRALCIDHINNNGAAERRKMSAGRNLARYLVNNNYPEGYQVLCHNCNIIKEYERRRNEGRNGNEV